MTIAAISTPQGVGGIAVVRLSGKEAQAVALKYVSRLENGKAVFATFRDGERLIDEVVVTSFPAPHSYTGDNVVEISCHGSIYVQQEILRLLVLDSQCRLAEPGEFTQRAFLNGKFDLSQAEAVADLIDSQSEVAHRLAVNQMRGGFSQKLKELRDKFVELTSLLELELDFSEEEVDFADRSSLMSLVDAIEEEIRQLADSFSMGNAIKRGVPVAIVGRPNVGKSTLLNALLGEDRAIVSPVAGTTRDTVEDTFILGGIQFRFIDTAGIRSSEDAIEMAGIERSYKAIRDAQIVLYLTDNDEPFETFEGVEEKTVIYLRNKVDIQKTMLEDAVPISAKTGEGMDELRSRLIDSVKIDPDRTMLTNVRHYEAMIQTLEALSHVRQGLIRNIPSDLVVIDLREALHHLGTITGQVTSDEVLGSIFGRFCIGK